MHDIVEFFDSWRMSRLEKRSWSHSYSRFEEHQKSVLFIVYSYFLGLREDELAMNLQFCSYITSVIN